jgi:hypothetical protein
MHANAEDYDDELSWNAGTEELRKHRKPETPKRRKRLTISFSTGNERDEEQDYD